MEGLPQGGKIQREQGSVRLRSLDQFYRYIERRESGTSVVGKKDGSGEAAERMPPATNLRYVLRNGMTIPVPTEKDLPKPLTVDTGMLPFPARLPSEEAYVSSAVDADPEPLEEDVAARDAEEAAHWRGLPRSVRLLLQLSPEPGDVFASDPMGERRQLVERLLNPLLSLEDTARLLNVCPATVRRWSNRGILPHHRTVGQQRRFYLADVLDCLERREWEGAVGKMAAGVED